MDFKIIVQNLSIQLLSGRIKELRKSHIFIFFIVYCNFSRSQINCGISNLCYIMHRLEIMKLNCLLRKM